MISNKSIINNNINTGNFLSFGSLDLSFILYLQKEDLTNYNVGWNNINSLEDITFLKNNINLWKRIDLSSNIDALKVIIQMNKITTNKIKIKYICFSSIKDIIEKNYFSDFIFYVTQENGIYLDSSDICLCQVNLQIKLNFENKEKILNLLSKDYNNKTQNKLIKEKFNPFSYINGRVINDYNYLYIELFDYITGEFKDKISIFNLYEFCAYIKLKTNIKIILNIKFEINYTEEFRDLLSLVDVSIFYDKKKLYEILKNLKFNEDIINQKEKIKEKELKINLKTIKIKNISLNKNIDTNDMKSIGSKRTTRTSLSQTNNNKIKIKKIKPMIPPKILEKYEMFKYYKKGICDKDILSKYNQKIVIAFDKFENIYFTIFLRNKEEPLILDFDMKLYPKANIYNLSLIKSYKKFLCSKFNEYIILFIGCLLNVIASKGINGLEENNLFLGYLIGVNYIKKISEIEKNNLILPRDKSFYYFNINKKEIKGLLEKGTIKRKEKFFILDGINKKKAKMKQYNPLLDRCLSQFFLSEKNKEFMKNKGFINEEGKLLFDPFYKDSFGILPNLSRNKKLEENEENLSEGKYSYDSRGYNLNKKIIKLELNKYIIGNRNKYPFYTIYKEKNNSKQILPSIKNYHFSSNKNYNINKRFQKIEKNLFQKINSLELLYSSSDK